MSLHIVYNVIYGADQVVIYVSWIHYIYLNNFSLIFMYVQEHVWPWAKHVIMMHDSYQCAQYPGSIGFPTRWLIIFRWTQYLESSAHLFVDTCIYHQETQHQLQLCGRGKLWWSQWKLQLHVGEMSSEVQTEGPWGWLGVLLSWMKASKRFSDFEEQRSA